MSSKSASTSLPVVDPPTESNEPIGKHTVYPPTYGPNPGDPGERFKHIELEINTVCDLACFACDRMSDVASKGVPNMTVAQVWRFVQESLDLNWEWERIRFLGGEPTLHPQFVELINLLVDYRRRHPNVFLQVLTNGLGKANQYRDWLTSLGISLHAEAKTRGVTPNWFNNTRWTPLDNHPGIAEVPPCGIFGIRGCGIGLTRYGYFLDGAGASAARVAGHDIGIQSLKEVTWPAMLDQARVLCRICGHWNPSDHLQTKKVTETGETTGPFWTQALAAYKAKKPRMTVYGGGVDNA